MDLLTITSYGVCIFFLRFAQRYLFLERLFKGKYLANVDTWIFLTDGRKIRQGNFRLSSKYREDRPRWDNDYPPLFFYLLAIFTGKSIKYVVKYASAFIDALLASILFSVTTFLTNNLIYGFLSVIVYSSSPMIFQQNFCLCVRPLSLLSISIVYLLSCGFSILNFITISVLISVILLLHKFASQIIFFTSLAFVIVGRFDFLLAAMLGFIIAMLISKGYYWKVLKTHINRLRTNDLKQFATSRTKNPIKRTVTLAFYCPWLIFFAISFIIIYPSSILVTQICTLAWIITLIALSAITNVGAARIIGEGWRYLGYIAFPMAFYVIAIIDYSPSVLWTYISLAILGTIFSYYYTRRLYQGHQNYLIDQEDIDTFKKISSIEGKRLIAYPNEFTHAIAYFSEKDYAVTPELTEIVVAKKKLAEKTVRKEIEEKGLMVKIDERDWIVYAR